MKNTLVIVGIVVLLLAGFYFFMSDDDMNDEINNTDTTDEENNDTNNNTGNTNGQSDSGMSNDVVLAENESGNFATISSATLTQPGFVVIYKVNSNGESTYMGSTDLLEAGTHSDMQVQLSGLVAEEETIVAVLRGDDGSGEFESGTDSFLSSGNSSITTDVDVVDVAAEDESESLEAQVEAYLEAEAETETEEEEM